MRLYRFICAARATYPIAALYRVLRVSRLAITPGRAVGPAARARADAEASAQIKGAHSQSRGIYGAPQIHADLRAAGVRTSRRRVARLLRAAGLVGCHRRHRPRTTVADPARPAAPNLVARNFAAASSQLWIGDITYVPTGASQRGGCQYIAAAYQARLAGATTRWPGASSPPAKPNSCGAIRG